MARRRALQIGLALIVGSAAWAVALSPERDLGEVLPQTGVEFSLDLEVVDTVDHPSVYAVEQRARPNYRILRLTPSTGEIDTVFTVPEDAIVFDIALSPDRSQLAVAYSPDFSIEGSGLSILDLESGEFSEVSEAESGRYTVDLSWALDGEHVLGTHVDRTGEDEILSMVELGLDGSFVELLDEGIAPVETPDGLYYLTLDEDNARRAIGRIDSMGQASVIEVLDGQADLDHLAANADGSQISIAVIAPDDGLPITIGEPASAHGNHSVPSMWFSMIDGAAPQAETVFGEILVYDAVVTDSSIVYATLEGLSIATDERVDVIESRAIRLVAG